MNAAQRLRAAWCMARLLGLIGRGLWQVQTGLARHPPAVRDARVQAWAQCVLHALSMRIEVQGKVQPRAGLVVANHVSWLDVVVLQAIAPEARFVAKSEVRDWPAVGRLARGVGTLFVDRRRPMLSRQSVDAIQAVLDLGGRVVVFPEGTTSEGHAVLPFRAMLLEAACRAGCAVQPLAIRYAEQGRVPSASVPYTGDVGFVQSLWRLSSATGLAVEVNCLAEVDAAGLPRQALARALHGSLAAALGPAAATQPQARTAACTGFSPSGSVTTKTTR